MPQGLPTRSVRFAVMLLAGVLAASAAGSVPAAPREFDDCRGAAWCPMMVVIPAGAFRMGAPADEPGAVPEEGPVHHVKLRSFAAGKFDVTRGQWAAFVAATSRETRLNCTWTGRTQFEPDPQGSWKNVGFAQDDTHPAVCISWTDAQDYVHWLSQRTGHTYRLLTEAEWEYAARAGTTTPYPWGTTASHEFANYGADACCSPRASGRDRWERTSPVGSFPPNAFGLYDMHGNVLQWVQDCLSMPYADPPLDGSANERDVPLHFTGDLAVLNTSKACEFRMARGGDWGDTPAMIRSASRNFGPVPGASLQDYSSGGVGFRVARTLP